LMKLHNGKPGSGPVVAHGTAHLRFPQGEPVIPEPAGPYNSVTIPAGPFTITLS
jgi:hypothetical protein